MKKIVIISALLVMGIALIYKYSSGPKQAPVVSQQASQLSNEEMGVPLPQSAKKSSIDSEVVGVCSKTVDDILSDFYRVWDVAPEKNAKILMNIEESKKISEALSDFQVCSALASQNRSKCDSLPYRGGFGGIYMPADLCRFKYDNFALAANFAGKYENASLAGDFIESHKMPELKVQELDSAIAKGRDEICPSLKNRIPSGKMSECYNVFPRNIGDCKDQECKDLVSVYEGISKSKSELCSTNFKQSCSAFINKSDNFCNTLKEKLLNLYCETYERVYKKQQEEAKKLEEMELMKLRDEVKQREYQERKKQDAQKAEEEKVKERIKKEQDKRNKEIKKILKNMGNSQGTEQTEEQPAEENPAEGE